MPGTGSGIARWWESDLGWGCRSLEVVDSVAALESERLMKRLEGLEAELRDARRRADDLLDETERHLRQLAESMPGLCWLTRSDGYVFWFNHRYREHTGLDPELAQGWGWRDFYPPGMADDMFRTWRDGIAGGEGFTATIPLPTPSGRLKNFQVRLEPFPEGRWFGINIESTGEATVRERLEFALAAGRLGAWELDVETLEFQASAICKANYGRSPGDPFTIHDLQESIHPADRARVDEAMVTAIRAEADYDIEYRVIIPSGEVRWVQVRGEAGFTTSHGGARKMAGVSMDVTERKAAEERQRLLLNELNHRVKNTLATVQSIAGQTLRTATSEAAFRDAFEARLVALSKTHNLLTDQNWRGASLHDLVITELRPHAGGREGGGSRFLLESDRDIRLTPKAAVALGMAVHELATNAVKYGALSVPGGRVAVRSRVADDRLTLDWIEAGGPPVEGPRRRGFGSRLLEQGLARELSGKVRLDYLPSGLSCRMDLPLHALEPDE
jgi:two-component sensor histidine kinase/PAS domain-containing protein